jgi:hypothetical protein
MAVTCNDLPICSVVPFRSALRFLVIAYTVYQSYGHFFFFLISNINSLIKCRGAQP